MLDCRHDDYYDATATDWNVATDSRYLIEATIGTRVPPTTTAGGLISTAFAWRTTTAPDGLHTITARVTFRNVSTKPVDVIFTLDNLIGDRSPSSRHLVIDPAFNKVEPKALVVHRKEPRPTPRVIATAMFANPGVLSLL